MHRLLLSVLIAISCATGTVAQDAPNPRQWLWRFVAGGAAVGTGAFDARGVYYFVAEDRYLYAVDPTGTMIWRTDLGRRPAGHVVVGASQSVYVTMAHGDVLSFNRDGRLVWSVSPGGDRPLAPVTLRTGLVILADETAGLLAVTHTGREVWRAVLPARLASSPVLGSDGLLYAATEAGRVEVFNPSGGHVASRFVGEVASVLAVGMQGVLIGSTSGRVVLLAYDLEPLWRADVGSAVRRLLVGPDGDAYATTDDGVLARITSSGAVAWRTEPRSPVVAHLPGDHLLVGFRGGTLARLSSDARTVWQITLPETPLSLTLAPYGALIVPAERWVTYAYAYAYPHPSGAGPPEAGWSEERGGPDRSGVPSGAGVGRGPADGYPRVPEFVALDVQLRSESHSMQVDAVRQIAAGIADGDLAGRYHYYLELLESIAGAPHFGPLTRFGPRSISAPAREQAVILLGMIGDLDTARFLARLLQYETDTAVQGTIVRAITGLGTGFEGDLVARLAVVVRRDRNLGASNDLASSIVSLVREVNRFEGGYLPDGVVELLMLIAEGNYNRENRLEAVAALREISIGP